MAEPKNDKPNKSVLADKLAGLKLDFEDYGEFPNRMDVQALVAPNGKSTNDVLQQYDKLAYIQKHLNKIDEYIKSKTQEPINDWDARTKAGLSTKVLSKLKGFNNKDGGISMYFHDLQTIYDGEEAMYDSMEAQCESDVDSKNMFESLRNDRLVKRKTRSDERKLLVKDLKKDGKGFLFVEVENAPVKDEAKEESAKENKPADGEKEVIDEKVKEETDKIQKNSKRIGVYIAGFTIAVTVVIAIASAVSEKKN